MKNFAIALLALYSALASAAAQNIEIALTDDRVAVDTGFAGARLTLFGAVTGIDDPSSFDIISVIRGPEAQFHVRQMKKENLIWTPGPAHLIDNAPGLYITYATRPVDDIAPLPDQAQYRLDADYLDIGVTAHATASSDDAQLFRSAFLSEAEALGLYGSRVGGIQFKKGALFTINARLPANTPVGEYDVAVYLFRNGEMIDSDSTALGVNRVGLEQRIYDFAHHRPVSYGFFCVALALIAGWLASLAFRK
ncbi:TIGR02186 family protein [Hyphococcus sp.]|uniref:TIGR02186 family protein n=1 Tax=Hyphococcus sp. TaxID=2038636 RepID=UPI00208123B2|nr:MAG: membrane protein [Marinicaulis sp.]